MSAERTPPADIVASATQSVPENAGLAGDIELSDDVTRTGLPRLPCLREFESDSPTELCSDRSNDDTIKDPQDVTL